MISKGINTFNVGDYCSKHLEVINAVIPVKLTRKEMEVVGTLISYSKDPKERFSAISRKRVRDMCGVSAQGFYNHMKSLESKGLARVEEDYYIFPPYFEPKEKEQEYNFKITLHESI